MERKSLEEIFGTATSTSQVQQPGRKSLEEIFGTKTAQPEKRKSLEEIFGTKNTEQTKRKPLEEIFGTAQKTTQTKQDRTQEIFGVKKPEEKSFGRKFVDFFTSSEQGLGQTFGDAIAVQTRDFKDALKSQDTLDDVNLQLVKKIKELEQGGETEKADRLRARLAQNVGLVQAEELAPSLDKSNKQIAGEALGVAADIASFGTYGTAAKGAKAGVLLTKGQQATNLASKGLAKTGLEAFKRGGIQAAKEGAVLGGAFSASEAMKADESAGQIAKNIALGTVTGGVLGMLLGGLSQRNVNEKAIDKAKQKAIESYTKGLRATKEKYKEKASEVVPWLLEQKEKGTLRQLLKKADDGIELAQKEYEQLGELKGIVSVDGLFKTIDEEMAKMVRPDGNVLSIKKTQFKTLQELKDDLQAFVTKDWIAGQDIQTRTVNQQKLRELAQDYGADLYETRKSLATVLDNKRLSQVKKVDSKIRELLNTNNPEYAKINELYHMNTTLKEVIEETFKRESSGFVKSVMNKVNALTGTGGAVLGMVATGGYIPAAITGITLVSITEFLRSTLWKTMSAVRKQKFADKMAGKQVDEISRLLRYFIANGKKALDEFLD